MIVEVVAVGTELLLGQIVNGNAARIGQLIAESGFDAHFAQTVGDKQERIESAIGAALARSDAVIVTGGIGPTQDDITREALAAVTGRPLRFSEEYAVTLRTRFAELGREMPPSNLRQAEYPDGAELMTNVKGTAPGLALCHDDRWIFLLPGVPAEMESLLVDDVLPRLRQIAGVASVLRSKVLRIWGLSEAAVGETLDDLFHSGANPSIAFLAGAGEIRIRITAKASSVIEADQLIRPVEDEIRLRLGASVFAVNDETIESVLIEHLYARGWTLGTAESATAGAIAARLASVSGASKVLRGAVVPYAADLKESLLGVPAETLRDGVVTENVAMALATGAQRVLGVDVGIGLTGSAGPERMERDVGTMIIAIATPSDVRVRTMRFPGDRERVRAYASTAALHLARLAVTDVWWRP